MASAPKTLAAANTRVFCPSQLRKMKGTEQVAAVCFRFRQRRIEFLLVQTGRGRWTFPKGSAEPGLTRAQAAALEAFEEAGVHGRMEEMSFARYTLPREGARGSSSTRSVTPQNLVVHAHLCEVSRLEAPQESGRNPTWFSPEKTKRRLRKDRSATQGDELAAVVDAAIDRVRCLASGTHSAPNQSGREALRRVEFEVLDSAHAASWIERATFLAYGGRARRSGNTPAIELALQTYLRRVLRMDQHIVNGHKLAHPRAAEMKHRRLLVGETSNATMPARVQRIDEVGTRSNRPRPERG